MYRYLIPLLTIISVTYAASIQWGFRRLALYGEREEVMHFTDRLQGVFETNRGERLINFLGIDRKRIDVEKKYETNEEVYSLLLKLSEEKLGKALPETFSVSDFKEEWANSIAKISYYSPYPFIEINGRLKNVEILTKYLNRIDQTQIGRDLFLKMKSCGKNLIIKDDKHSVSGGGYTSATHPGTGIFEGEGSDSRIRFRFDQPKEGSHLVQTIDGGVIPFSYITNLFHELVHAKHVMCGTMSAFSSEHQAIEEENAFRKSLPESSHLQARDPSKYEEGRQVWFGLQLKEVEEQ